MMNEQWIDLFREEIKAFAANCDAFDKGEISRGDYKGKSGGFGSYAQKDGCKHMLRLRMAGGRLTLKRLAFIADTEAEYNVEIMKLTTCETIQLHNLKADQVPQIMEASIDAEIYTRAGGGDNPRNIMMSPLAGVQEGEAFDVVPYAEAAGQYLLSICRDIKMPRKLKVAFCNGVDDCCHSAFRDMGFSAQEDGTFALSIAGGLGNNHRMGVRVIDHLPKEQILYAIRAMIETFCQHGDYTNRGKARTRYMQEKLGPDGLKAAYLENFEKQLAQGGLDCNPAPIISEAKGCTKCAAPADARVIAQKQPGLYAVSYHPIGGCIPAGKCAELYAILKDVPGAEGRIAPDETVYFINLKAADAEKVLAATEDGAKTPLEKSVACVGCTICQQGVRDSQNVLKTIIAAAREADLSANALPELGISGCPSSCAAPQSASIGFTGAAKPVDGKPQPAFRMFMGGTDEFGKAVFGDVVGTVLEADLPVMLVELGKAADAAGLAWDAYAAEHAAEVKEIVQKYI